MHIVLPIFEWRSIAAAVILIGPVLGLSAALRFDNAAVEIKQAEGGADPNAEFTFTNVGTNSIRVTNLHAGCGCTTPRLDKDTYDPGESGALRVAYHIGSREGHQSVQITVTTDEGQDSPYKLTLNVDILSPVKLLPRLVYWRIGEISTPKTIRLELSDGFTLAGIDTDGNDFAVAQSTETTAIQIRPRDTVSARSTVLKVRIKAPSGSLREYRVFARVLP